MDDNRLDLLGGMRRPPIDPEQMRRVLAEWCMGWIYCVNGLTGYWNDDQGHSKVAQVCWKPDERGDQYVMVIDAMREKGWQGTIRFGNGGVSASFIHEDGDSYHLHGEGDNAITRIPMECAYRALEMTDGD